MTAPLDFPAWKRDVIGRGIDRDGSGVPLAQCWDLWADYAERVLGVPLAWTFTLNSPGDPEHFLASSVYTRFPTPRVGDLGKHFVKIGRGEPIQAGDVLFWRDSARYRGSHVAIADGPAEPGGPWTITQNPGAARRERIPLGDDYLGALRPLVNIAPEGATLIGDHDMFHLELRGKHTYLVLANPASARPTAKGDEAKPYRAVLLGEEASGAARDRSLPLIKAHSAGFTMTDLAKSIGGIRAAHLKVGIDK